MKKRIANVSVLVGVGAALAMFLSAGSIGATGNHEYSNYCDKDHDYKNKCTKEDVCPNIEGKQYKIPEGMIKDSQGNCITPPVDICPNIDGLQVTVPAGLELKDGLCVVPPVIPPPVTNPPAPTPTPVPVIKPAPVQTDVAAPAESLPAVGEELPFDSQGK